MLVDQLRETGLADAPADKLHVRQVVVVAQDGEDAVPCGEAPQRPDEPPRVEPPGRVAGEVAGDGDEIGVLGVDHLGYAVQARGLGPVVEVEVPYLDNPVPVEG